MSFEHFHMDDPSNIHLSAKREFDAADDGDIFESTVKKICLNYEDARIPMPHMPQMPSVLPNLPKEEPKPYPFYFYNDFSGEEDPDPLTPLIPPGRVPNFPAKLHSMLARQDLADIIAWMPHGRSWRVLKPREFEVRVIPTYFEHAKFSSFIRQANGWGFRRITQGRDRNSYYHPLFLRGLPHLCKKMKRPGVSQKQTSDPDHEPDLYKISEMHPVPEKADDDMVLLQCTLQGGPKARVPVQFGSTSNAARAPRQGRPPAPEPNLGPTLTPSDQLSLAAFQKSLGASESQLTKANPSDSSASQVEPEIIMPSFPQMNMQAPSPFPMPLNVGSDKASHLALANQLAFAGTGNGPDNSTNSGAPAAAASSPGPSAPSMPSIPTMPPMPALPAPTIPKEYQGDTKAASQFAAGFAAATALSHQQFQTMLASLGASMSFFQQQQQNQGNQENGEQHQQQQQPQQQQQQQQQQNHHQQQQHHQQQYQQQNQQQYQQQQHQQNGSSGFPSWPPPS
eukprot:CAMPEP_0172442956 /NCGR_PEP_ID=MMETSP1065-20121228/3281_1 /TAXON_ID=265537 /ORGANISM="Amphiprora paludosa, Strain CCMP125" /LENGTH=508 /DNA_ID=CAMNT_0013193003 /DNA_START=9 /DNA_END=1535 /DNA_ORIENTATION=-